MFEPRRLWLALTLSTAVAAQVGWCRVAQAEGEPAPAPATTVAASDAAEHTKVRADKTRENWVPPPVAPATLPAAEAAGIETGRATASAAPADSAAKPEAAALEPKTAEDRAAGEPAPPPTAATADTADSDAPAPAVHRPARKEAASAAVEPPPSQAPDVAAKEPPPTSSGDAPAAGASTAEVPATRETASAAEPIATPASPGSAAAETSTEPAASTASLAPASAEPPNLEGVKVAIVARLAEGAAVGKVDPDLAALTSFYAARDNAPLWVGPVGFTPRAEQVLATLTKAADWGLDAKPLGVPKLDAAAGTSKPSDADLGAADVALSRAALTYVRHARGGRMDPHDLSYAIDRDPPLLAPATVIEDLGKAENPGDYLTDQHPRHSQFEKLRQAYLRLKGGDAAARKKAQRVLLNLEQWRWMPRDMGALYVWTNIPEFLVRVVKQDRVIHTERVIAGKVTNQTPLFSDEMETIVFHPTWGVPDSIKVKEILPSLLKGGKVLAQHNLRIARGGRDVDPAAVDWRTTDIRNFHVYQPPGGSNVLGVVKFLFPNKHQVYMHDTPTKKLFNASSRTFSHGCMRIRDPLTLAGILLAEDKSWPQSRVASLAKPGSGQNNSVTLSRKIQVHVTYFTASVDEKGELHFHADVYGHEKRIQMGLDGKAHLIPKQKESLAEARADVIARLGEAKPSYGYSGGVGGGRLPDWARNAFGNN